MTNREWLNKLNDKDYTDFLNDLATGRMFPEDFCSRQYGKTEKDGVCRRCCDDKEVKCDLSVHDMLYHWLKSGKEEKE